MKIKFWQVIIYSLFIVFISACNPENSAYTTNEGDTDQPSNHMPKGIAPGEGIVPEIERAESEVLIFYYKIKNAANYDYSFVFPVGQEYDYIIYDHQGNKVYQYSDELLYSGPKKKKVLQPGEEWVYKAVVSDLEIGEYTIEFFSKAEGLPLSQRAAFKVESPPDPSLDIAGIRLGMDEDEIYLAFGKPVKIKAVYENLRQIFFTTEGYGIQVKVNMRDGKIGQLWIYPSYISDSTAGIPRSKMDVQKRYGSPQHTKTSACFANAECDVWVYQMNDHALEFLFQPDGESIERIQFYYLD